MSIPAPLQWALKIVMSYLLDWCYEKLRMHRRLKRNKRERRELTSQLIAALKNADTEQEKRDALDNIARGGFG